jgi:hypothetical protein
LPPLDTLERIAHATLLFGFPCMTLGLLVGSLLAQESVGPAYFFDPKVLLSFGMWILYVALLYIRRSAGLRGRRAAYLSSGVFVGDAAGVGRESIQPGTQVSRAMSLDTAGHQPQDGADRAAGAGGDSARVGWPDGRSSFWGLGVFRRR